MRLLQMHIAIFFAAISAAPLMAGGIEGSWDCKVGSAVKTTITYKSDGTFTSRFAGDGIRQGVRVKSTGQASGTWVLAQGSLTEHTSHAELAEFEVEGAEKLGSHEAKAFLADLIGQTNVSDVLKLNKKRLLLRDARNRVHCKRMQ